MDELELNEAEQKFVKNFSDFVNRDLNFNDINSVGEALARDHRTLIQHKFCVMLPFMETLAYNYHKGYFDPRNEYSCKCCAIIIDTLIEQKLYTPYNKEYKF